MANRLLFLVCISLLVALTLAAAPQILNCQGTVANSVSPRSEYICIQYNVTTAANFSSISFFINSTTAVFATYSTANGTRFFLGPLSPNTVYRILAAQAGTTVFSNPIIITTATTSLNGPIKNPPIDLSSVSCVGGINSATQRTQITCTWTNPTPAPYKVVVSAICRGLISASNSTLNISGRKQRNHIIDPIVVRSATTITFAVNRHPAQCNVLVRARYNIPTGFPRVKVGPLRRKGGAKHFNVVKGHPYLIVVTV